MPKALESTNERSTTLVASYQPESDLKALIERYRTGPFHPLPQVYESIAHDESDIPFGIDLRKWAPPGPDGAANSKELYPNVLSALLEGMKVGYGKLPSDAGKWSCFIKANYISSTHLLMCREAQSMDL